MKTLKVSDFFCQVLVQWLDEESRLSSLVDRGSLPADYKLRKLRHEGNAEWLLEEIAVALQVPLSAVERAELDNLSERKAHSDSMRFDALNQCRFRELSKRVYMS